MRRTARWIGVAAFLALAAGCSVNKNFVYKPDPAVAGGPRLPVNVAVLPFEDGTENFTFRGGVFGSGQYNLAKTGIAGALNVISAEMWGKSFADELSASNSFRSARFVFNAAEIRQDESLLVEGTVKKATYAANTAAMQYANEILVSFRARRASDRKVVWEKETGASWKELPDMSVGCSLSPKCNTEAMHESWNRRMAVVMAEARKDLVRTLAALSESGAARDPGAKEAPPAPESLDRTIEKILKGN